MRLGLLCILATAAALAAGAEPASPPPASPPPAAPRPGTQRFAIERGPKLLADEKWAEAAEAFDVWYDNLSDAVWKAWAARPDSPAADQKRYRRQLLDFYVRHAVPGAFSAQRAGWEVQTLADLYRDVTDGTAPRPRDGAPDFSHLDLLKDIPSRAYGGRVTAADVAAVRQALASDPDSLPATVLYLLCLRLLPSVAVDGLSWADAGTLLKTPGGRLALARAIPDDLAGIGPDVANGALRNALDLAASGGEKARLLCLLARVEAQRVKRGESGTAVGDVVAAAARAYQSFPSAYYAAEARKLAVRALLDAGDFVGAEALIRMLRKRADQREGLDQALYDVAHARQEAKDWSQAEALLQEVIKESQDDWTAARAMLDLPAVYAARGDEAKELEWLKRCAEDVRTRGEALPELGTWYEKRGEWRKALDCWIAWAPASACGTCTSSMHHRRMWHIRAGYARLGDPAAWTNFFWQTASGPPGYQDDAASEFGAEIVALYDQAGQSDDLLSHADAADKTKIAEYKKSEDWRSVLDGKTADQVQEDMPTWPIRGLLRVRRLSRQRDIPGLVAVCREIRGYGRGLQELGAVTHDWRLRAAEALADMGGGAVADIREALQPAPPALEAAAGDAPLGPPAESKRIGLIYVLALSRSPEAMELLEDLSRRAGEEAPIIASALSMKGEAGRGRLERISKWEDDEAMKAAALQQLEDDRARAESSAPSGRGEQREDDVPPPAFPSAPKAGSLSGPPK